MSLHHVRIDIELVDGVVRARVALQEDIPDGGRGWVEHAFEWRDPGQGKMMPQSTAAGWLERVKRHL